MSQVSLLEQSLPRFDVAKRQDIRVQAPREAVWRAVLTLDLSASGPVRALFRLRGLPRSALRWDGLERLGFVPLGERPERELVFGLVGRFWTPSGHLQSLDAEGFRAFAEPGFAKAVWGFELDAEPAAVRLSTETRVLCLDAASCRRFRAYWLVVGPFSTWIRRESLRLIKRRAEASRRR